MDYDKTAMPAAYDSGRGYDPATLAYWLDVIAAKAPPDGVARILDLGCGTGRFSAGLAQRFDADVIAVDPSANMLAEARRKAAPRVRYEQASGEALPLADASIDLVFMSMVFHHFADPERVARECFRALRPGGRLLLRAGTVEQIHTYPYLPFFPSSDAILRRVLTPRAAIEAVFARAGFAAAGYDLVPSPTAKDWNEYAARVAHRADSVLIQLSDEEFGQGLAALRAHKAPPGQPVIELVDFFAFQRPAQM
ncbi:MAG TPA: class I SAM-dependent methyltransferase [Rhizomicrobium sp.]